MSKLYKAIDVWKRRDNKAIRFRCFEIVSEKKFCVQSVDYFSLPLVEDTLKQLEIQFLELFIEAPPEERSDSYSSLEEAIQNYEDDF